MRVHTTSVMKVAKQRDHDYTWGMEDRAVGTPIRQESRWRSAWRFAVVALIFVLLAHHVLMATPLRDGLATMISPMHGSNAEIPRDDTCPTGIISLCVPGRVCVTGQAALIRLPLTLLMFLILIALAAIAIRPLPLILWHMQWLWPPARRRALLQVFLI